MYNKSIFLSFYITYVVNMIYYYYYYYYYYVITIIIIIIIISIIIIIWWEWSLTWFKGVVFIGIIVIIL